MIELIDYRLADIEPRKEERTLVVFRARNGGQIEKYGVWVTDYMASDEVILKPFLLQVAEMLNSENKEMLNPEVVFKS